MRRDLARADLVVAKWDAPEEELFQIEMRRRRPAEGLYLLNKWGEEVNWLMITINLERCTGCGACLEVCPDSALYLVDDQAVVDSALCRECEVCIAACPTGAIIVTEQQEEPTPATARVPAVRPAPNVIQIKTESSLAHLRTRVLPVVGTALIWTAREIAPRLAVYFLDSMDRRAAQRRARGIAQHTSGTESQTGHGGGGRHHRRRRRGS